MLRSRQVRTHRTRPSNLQTLQRSRAARSPRPRLTGECAGHIDRSALGEAFGNPPAVFARQNQRTAAQRFKRHVERQHARVKTATGSAVADRIQFILQIAQRPQLFDGRRHEARILQDAIRRVHFLRNLSIVPQARRDARSRQIVELTARCRGGYTLFN
jgi:hypothetical protein